jgi:hypothetical protein
MSCLRYYRHFFTLLLALSFLSVSSARAENPTSVRALGMQKCSAFTDALLIKRDRNATVLYSQWLAGFLTGRNVTAGKMDLFPVREPLDEWVRLNVLICSTNKEKRLFEVAEGILLKLEKYDVIANDTLVEINYNDGKSKITVYRSFLKKSQSFLRSKGYSVRPDGNWGERTEKAFSAFKKDKNIGGAAIPDAFFLTALIANK